MGQHLARRRHWDRRRRAKLWWLGTGIEALGHGCYMLAVSSPAGQLSIIQPLVSLHVVVAVVLGAHYLGEEVSRRRWLAVAAGVLAAMALGALAQPQASHEGVGWRLLAFAAVAALLVVAMVVRLPTARWSLIAAACFSGSVVALRWLSLAAQAAPSLSVGWFALHWASYAVVVFFLAGFLATQLAFRRTDLSTVMPLVALMSLVGPVAAAVTVFGETLVPAQWLALGVVMIAVWQLRGAGPTPTSPPA